MRTLGLAALGSKARKSLCSLGAVLPGPAVWRNITLVWYTERCRLDAWRGEDGRRRGSRKHGFQGIKVITPAQTTPGHVMLMNA